MAKRKNGAGRDENLNKYLRFHLKKAGAHAR